MEDVNIQEYLYSVKNSLYLMCEKLAVGADLHQNFKSKQKIWIGNETIGAC